MMDALQYLYSVSALAPILLMAVVGILTKLSRCSTARLWRVFQGCSCLAIPFTAFSLLTGGSGSLWPWYLKTTPLSLVLALLVELLGAVIGGFSARYLQGEAGQRRFVASLATLLAAVHLLLMADHWLILILAWASVGAALQPLLCFYPNRPFALLAAHKKYIADRAADVMLIGAAAISWGEVGSGSFSALWDHLATHGISWSLHASAIALIIAVILRTAMLPVHGWLTQVMEAPTPVSALLHAGVVNLSGFVLIRFAPLLEQSALARILLLVFGLATAVLAGMVMLTRVSIKVRLAWSTIAQMGFMLLECALGLYEFAALHLIGHSLYKAHAFLSASTVVRQARLQTLHGSFSPSAASLALAPILTVSMVFFVKSLMTGGGVPLPWWWCVVISLSWAPLLWLPAFPDNLSARIRLLLSGLVTVVGLTGVVIAAHAVPLGMQNSPHQMSGLIVLTGMIVLYLFQALLQQRPQSLARWRQWSYAGFYVDEAYTRLALWIWPTDWTSDSLRRLDHNPSSFRVAYDMPVAEKQETI